MVFWHSDHQDQMVHRSAEEALDMNNDTFFKNHSVFSNFIAFQMKVHANLHSDLNIFIHFQWRKPEWQGKTMCPIRLNPLQFYFNGREADPKNMVFRRKCRKVTDEVQNSTIKFEIKKEALSLPKTATRV